MAIGRTYPIKKSAVKAYGYTSPPKKRSARSVRGPRFAANGSVTHIAAINGRGSYSRSVSARSRMSGLRSNSRRTAARSSLSASKKTAFAKKMRALKKNSSRSSGGSSGLRVKRKTFRANARGDGSNRRRQTAGEREMLRKLDRDMPSIKRRYARSEKTRARAKPARRKATRKTPMARKTRRRKKAAARKLPVRRAKRRVKRRKSAKRSAVAPKRRKRRKARKTVAKAPVRRKRRRKAKKTTLKANRKRRTSRRRLRKNAGTRAGALKGWRKRRSAKKRKTTSRKRRSPRAKRVVRRRRRSRKTSAVAPKRRRRSRRKLTANRKRRTSRRRLSANPRRRRSSHRRTSSRRLRRNGRRRMFRRNGIMEPLVFIAKTGTIALAGLLAHKVISNALTTYVLNRFLGSPAAIVDTSATTTAVVPATAGLGGMSLDPQYQRLIGSFLVAGLGVFASAKVIKDPTTRNTVMTGIGLSFMTTLFSAVLTKFAPQYSGILAGPSDGTAARLSAMYGFGGTSLQPRYAAIGGRGMGEYFDSGVSGLGEYFTSGVSGLGEYFQSGVSGMGALPSYEANAGYGANPDLMEAAAGMGARETLNTNHVDPHGDLDRQLTIAEAAAGVGAYEAAAGFGSISTVPSSSTWIPGMSDGQIWSGTRSISSPQSASEMTPAGILQTDGGQGVFG